MNKKRDETATRPDIEEIAEQASQGHDVSEYFTGQHSAKQHVNIDFPLDLMRAIDAECKLVGVTRQAWIKMACDERLRQVRLGRVAFHNAEAEEAIPA
jgi:hypothetical protein